MRLKSDCEEPNQRDDQHQIRRDPSTEMQMNLAGRKEMVWTSKSKGGERKQSPLANRVPTHIQAKKLAR